jgi:hypothetical protein
MGARRPLRLGREATTTRNPAGGRGFPVEVWPDQGFWMKAVLSLVGIAFIIAWLVLWLAVKITFGAIHLLVVIGVILIVLAIVNVV